MQGNKLQKLYFHICSSAVFRGVLTSPVFTLFGGYCLSEGKPAWERMNAYAEWVAELYRLGGDLNEITKKLLLSDENVYIKAAAHREQASENVVKAASRELVIFSEFASLTPQDFAKDMGVEVTELPAFDGQKEDFSALYAQRLQKADKYGYGIFSAGGMFRLSDQNEIEPIVSADKIGMGHFIGYEAERAKVVANTRAFVEGRPAANTLLCGDAGTGKSSTVKAIANDFFTEGVRLIELRKDQLRYLPSVMAKISGNPLKFIIFIDDLSFNQNNDDFSMLKAALEGSASATADNAVIYATSNRRHIVKESFGERDGDDVHRNDTLQETLSLSERFGLTVLFSKPDKKLYLTIVRELAKRYGVAMDEKELDIQAEAFALRKGSRSARAAEQFVDSLL